MLVQSLLRHAMAEAISEGFINCLIVTSVADANIQLSRIHEHLFARECFARFSFRFHYSPFSCSLGRVFFHHNSPILSFYQNAEELIYFQFISFPLGLYSYR